MTVDILFVGDFSLYEENETSMREAPALFDYQVVVADPRQVLELTNDWGRLHGNLHIPHGARVNRAGFVHTELNQRSAEAQRLLENGGLLVVMGYSLTYFTLELQFGKSHGRTNYDFLPSFQDASLQSSLTNAKGKRIENISQASPFRHYLYKGLKDDEIGFETVVRPEILSHWPDHEVIATDRTGQPVAISFRVFNGTLVLLPPSTYPGSTVKPLMHGIVELFQTRGVSSPPDWLEEFASQVPGLAHVEGRLRKLRQDADALDKSISEADSERLVRREWLKLLYEDGEFQLEPVVRKAFRLLGFEVQKSALVDASLEADGRFAVAQITGSESQVQLPKAKDLLSDVSAWESAAGAKPKGVLVINGWRWKEPGSEEEVSEAVMGMAREEDFCLVSSHQLFQLVSRLLDSNDEEIRGEIRTRIFETSGWLELPTLE